MPTLNVPNATLNYKVTGTGPVLLCIPGANGEHSIFDGIANALAKDFTVVTYDRRGFSESLLTGAQDYANRLQTDADDAAALIKEVGKGEPAFVFANSSGAIVSLQLLSSHPEVIRTLICHEPPTLVVLPKDEAEERIADQHKVYELYREQGQIAASQDFLKGMSAIDKVAMSHKSGNPFTQANSVYWFEREVLTYPFTVFDTDLLAKSKDKLLMGIGKMSNGSYPQRCAEIWAKTLGVPTVELAGGHVGFAMFAEAFAEDIKQALQGR